MQVIQQQDFEDVSSVDSFFENQILIVKETAELLRVSTKTVYKLARAGEIPCMKIGRGFRFLRSELIGWMKKGGSYA